ncbi:MAG: cupin domain-containing protein [Candidatus Heimdallarchaeota archaeon]|nr:MAG: cupin domain-containing protein [Candidatus Heimdallarchaeota archaeon]
MEEKYGYLKVINIPELIESCTDQWFNQTLCHVNDSVVRVGIIQGEFHWHKHTLEDEFFYVIEGRLLIDLEGEMIELKPKQGYTVPKGITHRTRAPKKTVILMVEKDTVKPVGNE